MTAIQRTKSRLEYGVLILSLIDNRRAETGSPNLGSNIERQIILRELAELEEQVLDQR